MTWLKDPIIRHEEYGVSSSGAACGDAPYDRP
jgi:hypothetical protein